MGTNWAEFARNRIVKILAVILVAAFLLIVFIGLFTKKAINVWGLKFNINDTIYLTKHDTSIIYKTIPAQNPKTSLRLSQKNDKGDNNQAGRDNNGAQGGRDNKNHIVNGTNNGVNGDLINGIKQRHISQEGANEIISKIPNKATSIDISYSEDKESLNYAKEIEKTLISQGYKNVVLHGWIGPDGFDKVTSGIEQDGVFRIYVYPSSNVN